MIAGYAKIHFEYYGEPFIRLYKLIKGRKTMANFETIRLDKGLYSSRKGFTAELESVDPVVYI